jgi:hypothetical protein
MTIPVANTTTQENSTKSVRSMGMHGPAELGVLARRGLLCSELAGNGFRDLLRLYGLPG